LEMDLSNSIAFLSLVSSGCKSKVYHSTVHVELIVHTERCRGHPAVEVTRLVNVDPSTGEVNVPPDVA
jgi:hypothetical protein